jgi:splicing factor 3A subunit 2
MVQIFIEGFDRITTFDVESNDDITDSSNIVHKISESYGIPKDSFYITTKGGKKINFQEEISSLDLCFLSLKLKINGGIDFQHREGSKIGGGGHLSESQAAVERRERLRKLALETIDISKDPYFMRNHLGSYECKLCLTLHNNEGNYLAHTQGKRHQSNLGRRAAMEAKNAAPRAMIAKVEIKRRGIKIGRPGYKVTKSRDLHTRQRSLIFEVDYPEAEGFVQPRHRFMSAYEQKVETPDKNFQYLLFACDPYETVAFKIPNQAIDKKEGRFHTNWDAATKKFVLTMHFLETVQTVRL